MSTVKERLITCVDLCKNYKFENAIKNCVDYCQHQHLVRMIVKPNPQQSPQASPSPPVSLASPSSPSSLPLLPL